ncbi:MAG: hypothetical protein HOA67_00080 [Candidatus Marinimicrobia bacterium]|jgi:hypothetical protein|nr:hypothetical protein [Candidatus Neomarinimicrobiota bacterium]
MNNKQSNAINEIKADAKKLNDRELLEEIYNNQIDENFHSSEIKKQIYLSTIMIAVVLSIALIGFYK